MATKRIEIKKHHTNKELKQRYLNSIDVVEKSHWQIIWLMSMEDKNYSSEEVSRIMGVSSDWVRKIVRRYNKDGAKGIEDKRKYNGNKPILNEKQQEKLSKMLSKKPEDHGLWNGPKVAHWMSKELGMPVSTVTGWHYLTRLGWSLQIPRRQHKQSATLEEQEAFKKNSRNISNISD